MNSFPLIKRDISDTERDLLSLPAKFGGLGIFNPCERATSSLPYSEALCAPLVALVMRQADAVFNPAELREDQKNIRAFQDFDMDYNYDRRMKAISALLPPETQRGIVLAREKCHAKRRAWHNCPFLTNTP